MFRKIYIKINSLKQEKLKSYKQKWLPIFFILNFWVVFTGYTQEPDEKKWDIHIANGNLLQAIKEIENVTQASISYNASKLQDVLVSEKQYDDLPISSIINDLLAEQPLSLRKQNDTYIIIEKKVQRSGSATVNGPIVHGEVSNGIEKLSGVTIKEVGSNTTVVSSATGDFKLAVTKIPTKISFSYVGHEMKMVTISDTALQFITLTENAGQLDNVVVTALNVKREAKGIGYAVEKIKGDKVNEIKTVSIATALTGKIPGVNISNTANGVAGSRRVTLRGISSITGNNQPLWVIDGIPISTNLIGNATADGGGGMDFGDGLTGINPDDIESISVLKGNAAAALYGSRASNGVILLTTKAGRDIKKKLEVSYNSTYTIDKVVDFTNWQYEYGQGTGGKKPASQQEALVSGNAGWGARLDGSNVVQFDGVERPYLPHENNLKDFYTNGNTWTNTVSLAGHFDNHNFRLSISHLDNKDIVPNSTYARNNFSIHSESRFGKLSVNVVADFIDERAGNRQRIGGNYSNVHYTLINLPTNIYVKDLQPGYDPSGNETGINNQGIPTNPYYVTSKIHQDDQRKRFIGSLELKYDFTRWLYAKGRVLEDYFDFKELDYTPNGVIWFPKGGGLNQDWRTNNELNYEFIIGSSFSFLDKFKFNGFAGGNVYKTKRETYNLNGSPFVIDGIYTANNLSVKYPTTGFYRKQINSLFASTEFSYDDLIFLNFTGRQDWFSTLPVNNNNLFYPSVSLSYLFNRHLSLPDWVSYGKLRGSFAQVSGDTDPYQLDLGYSLDRDIYNGINLQRIANSTIPNVNLQPLLSSEIEFGTDIAFFKDAISLNLTYYKRKTTQDIVTTQISNTSGFQQAILNVGEISNKGFEAAIKIIPIKSKDFKWEVAGNFSYNDNKVLSLGSNLSTIQLAISKTGNASINVEKGQRYGMIEGYRYSRNEKGVIIYDANGYPVSSGIEILGNGLYDKLAGLSNTLTYKNLSFYFLIDGKFGAQIYSEQNSLAVSNGKHQITLGGRENGIIGNGSDELGNSNTVMVPIEKLNQYYGRVAGITENFVYDASFVKLRELSLGYHLPKNGLPFLPFTNAYVSVVARNLFILYKNTPNIDPESGTISGNAQGISATVYPTTRNYGVNLSLNF